MKAIYFSFLLLLALTLVQCKTTQTVNNSTLSQNASLDIKNPKPGSCYAKCLVPDQVEQYAEEYPIFTGNEQKENVNVLIKEFVIKPKSSQWIKKKTDKNCLSRDPNDCLVWCLVNVPAVTETLKILVDTTQSSNYEMRTINYQRTIKKGGFTEVREVLCNDQVTRLVIGQLQNALREKGYFAGADSFVFDTTTKASLSKFQKENNLPVGQLDLDTLDSLGVIIK